MLRNVKHLRYNRCLGIRVPLVLVLDGLFEILNCLGMEPLCHFKFYNALTLKQSSTHA